MDEFDRYQDQQRAWREESARRAAMPWWEKAACGIQDFAALHRLAIWIVALLSGAGLIGAAIAWLVS